LLVPREVLTEHFEGRLSGSPDHSFLDLNREIRSAASIFEVSEECLLVQLQRAAERGHVKLPSNLCAFSLRCSDRSGGRQRVGRALRNQTALMPRQIDDIELRRIFPGLAARHLGPAFSSWAQSLAPSPGDVSGQIKIPIHLLTAGKVPTTESFTLSG